MISQLHSQVDKDSLKINEKKVYNIISKDSLEKIQTLPVLPYSYNKSISDNDNIDKIFLYQIIEHPWLIFLSKTTIY